MSLMNSSAILAESVGTMVKSRILIDGNYTCHATNEYGNDSKTFHVSLIGKIKRLFAMKNDLFPNLNWKRELKC